MKRSFSLKELQSAIDDQASNASRQSIGGAQDAGSVHNEHRQPEGPVEGLAKTLMRRSKSMTSFSEQTSEQMARDGISAGDIGLSAADIVLPSLNTLLSMQGASLDSSHVVEETKRGRGESGKFAGTGMDSPQLSHAIMNDEETLGAASALMQLSSSPSTSGRSPILEKTASPRQRSKPVPVSSTSPSHPAASILQPSGSPTKAELELLAPTGLLPPLSYLLGGIAMQQSPPQQQHAMQMHAQVQATAIGAAVAAGAGSPLQHPGLSAMHEAAAAWQQQQVQDVAVAGGGGAGGEDGEAKHNKYCHFCQHVKVKRATSMLACVNVECARRFCEHCLVTHLSELVPKPHEAASWRCPICRKTCCCAVKMCDRTHRHCKAFRYRQRRAEQAAKRTQNTASAGAGGKGSAGGGWAGPAGDAKGKQMASVGGGGGVPIAIPGQGGQGGAAGGQ